MVQIIHRLKYSLQNQTFNKVKTGDFSFQPPRLDTEFIPTERIAGHEISFLNKSVPLDDLCKPGTYRTFLPLEQYTLHYMDYLLDPAFDTGRIAGLVEFYERNTDLPFAFDPYPVSLRLVNLLKAAHSATLDHHTVSHIDRLGRFLETRLELHILGNHLLKNIKALIFYHVYFRHDVRELEPVLRRLLDQLDEQLLPDGWHFERTPTYHLIVLEDLLDVYHLLSRPELEHVKDPLERRIAGLLHVTGYWLDDYPLFNDSSYGSAPHLRAVHRYAEALGFEITAPGVDHLTFPDAGYFAYFNPGYTIWIDAGDLGPKYLPGHAHNDSLSFILYHGKSPLFGDTGVGSYQERELRDISRSVKSHNTVGIDDIEPSEFWGEFRYARKVKLCSREVRKDRLRAEIAYRGRRHERTWDIRPDGVTIHDRIAGGRGTAFFHLAEGCDVRIEEDGKRAIISKEGKAVAEVRSEHRVQLEESLYFPGMNDVRRRPMLASKFSGSNKTEILIG